MFPKGVYFQRLRPPIRKWFNNSLTASMLPLPYLFWTILANNTCAFAGGAYSSFSTLVYTYTTHSIIQVSIYKFNILPLPTMQKHNISDTIVKIVLKISVINIHTVFGYTS